MSIRIESRLSASVALNEFALLGADGLVREAANAGTGCGAQVLNQRSVWRAARPAAASEPVVRLGRNSVRASLQGCDGLNRFQAVGVRWPCAEAQRLGLGLAQAPANARAVGVGALCLHGSGIGAHEVAAVRAKQNPPPNISFQRTAYGSR